MAALRSHIDALNSHCASSAFSQIKLDEDTVSIQVKAEGCKGTVNISHSRTRHSLQLHELCHLPPRAHAARHRLEQRARLRLRAAQRALEPRAVRKAQLGPGGRHGVSGAGGGGRGGARPLVEAGGHVEGEPAARGGGGARLELACQHGA